MSEIPHDFNDTMTPAKSTPLSPAETLVDGYFPFTASPDSPSKAPMGVTMSPARKYVLFAIFCLAQFLDAFNNSALFSAMPSFIIDLGITEGQSTWIMSAFQLTFASFLLVVSTATLQYNIYSHPFNFSERPDQRCLQPQLVTRPQHPHRN